MHHIIQNIPIINDGFIYIYHIPIILYTRFPSYSHHILTYSHGSSPVIVSWDGKTLERTSASRVVKVVPAKARKGSNRVQTPEMARMRPIVYPKWICKATVPMNIIYIYISLYIGVYSFSYMCMHACIYMHL